MQKTPNPGPLERYLFSGINEEWEGVKYEEKEVSVYYREVDKERVILTTKARYGKDFPREREVG